MRRISSFRIALLSIVLTSTLAIAEQRILITGSGDGYLHLYKTNEGATELLTPLNQVLGAEQMVLGPDGLVYVTSSQDNAVFRFNADTKHFIDMFASGLPLSGATGLAFGNDGYVYIGGALSNNIVRVDASTGAFAGEFVAPGIGGLSAPQALVFGPDGNLYVSSSGSDEILKFAKNSGDFLGVFASGGGLDEPLGFMFGNDRKLYVTSGITNQILRFDSISGAFVDIFIDTGLNGTIRPHDVKIGPDGHLYITGSASHTLQRYDHLTGEIIESVVTPGLSAPTYILSLDPIPLPPSNEAPIVSASTTSANHFIGDTLRIRGLFTDPDSSSWELMVDYQDGSPVQNIPLTTSEFSLAHTYRQVGNYTVIIAIVDDEGGEGSTSIPINIQALPTRLSLFQALMAKVEMATNQGRITGGRGSDLLRDLYNQLWDEENKPCKWICDGVHIDLIGIDAQLATDILHGISLGIRPISGDPHTVTQFGQYAIETLAHYEVLHEGLSENLLGPIRTVRDALDDAETARALNAALVFHSSVNSLIEDGDLPPLVGDILKSIALSLDRSLEGGQYLPVIRFLEGQIRHHHEQEFLSSLVAETLLLSLDQAKQDLLAARPDRAVVRLRQFMILARTAALLPNLRYLARPAETARELISAINSSLA